MDYEGSSDYGISSDDTDDEDDASSSRAGTGSGAASSSALPASGSATEMDTDAVQEPSVAETAMPRALVEGQLATHDFGWRVKVLILVGEEAWQANKTFVEIQVDPKKRKQPAGQMKRWVHTDALSADVELDLESVTPGAAPATASQTPDAFNVLRTGETAASRKEAAQQAAMEQLDADGVPRSAIFASIERKRKMRFLRASQKRARRPKMGERVTNEPKDPEILKRRLDEYPCQSLIISNNKLFCQSCCSELSLRKSTVNAHCVKSQHHRDNYAKWLAKKEQKTSTVEVSAPCPAHTTHSHFMPCASLSSDAGPEAEGCPRGGGRVPR